MKNNFSIAIQTGTYNPNISVFRRSLNALKIQQYNGKISHLILDGGSTNGAIQLARQYGCKILSYKNDTEEGSNRLFPTLKYISSDIVLIIESDNILTSKDWLQRIVEPFRDPRIFATYSMHNDYEQKDNMLTKYYALFGSPDPTLYYLHKSDKVRRDQSIYDKGEIIRETKSYFVVRFNKQSLPVMGDNGFAIRTNVLRKVVYRDKPYYHTDAYAQLLYRGYDTVGVVKNSIIHVSRPDIPGQVKRRVEVKIHFTDEKQGKRKYLVYNPKSLSDQAESL